MEQNNPAALSAAVSSAAPAPAFPLVREGRYLWILLGLLMSVTVFEGYDVTIFHLCTPDIARTFHLDDRAVGMMASLVRLGGMLAVFVVMLSDRLGRKPVVSATVLFYTLFTLLTALSRGLWSFTTFQSCAQIFLSAEFSVAIIMISEEFPDGSRGRGVAMLHAVGLLGVIAGGLLYGHVADSRWGWRGMYFIGIIPLLLVAFLRRGIRETLRFDAFRKARADAPAIASGAIAALRHAVEPLRGPYRGRLILVALLWNCVGLVSAPSVTFFTSTPSAIITGRRRRSAMRLSLPTRSDRSESCSLDGCSTGSGASSPPHFHTWSARSPLRRCFRPRVTARC